MNAIADNLRLYDISTRHQIYIEHVKAGVEGSFNYDLANLAQDMQSLFLRTNYENVGSMTRAQLNFLLVQLRRLQATFYSALSAKLITQLQDYMTADIAVSRKIYAASVGWSPSFNEPVDDDQSSAFLVAWTQTHKVAGLFGVAAITSQPALLWAKILAAPIPANGATLASFLKAFTSSASVGAENLIRQAWANKWTMRELMTAFFNTSRQGQASFLDRTLNQGRAVISTILQHVKSFVAAGVQSLLFPQYLWVSVIDSRTTVICQDLNLKRFFYGKGPIPPAHVRCRSHITPLNADAPVNVPTETLSRWLARQPETVQKDIVDRVDATGKFQPTPLTLAQFKTKLRLILA